jgi:hypothetical protein
MSAPAPPPVKGTIASVSMARVFRAGHLGYGTAVRLYRSTGWHNFTLTTLHRLATALGVSVAELVADDEGPGVNSGGREVTADDELPF